MSYSYATAKAVLSEGEKDRILALYLSIEEPNVDWDKATQAFGAASVDSMKVSTRNLLKKIANAGGKTGVTAPSTVVDGAAPQTPKTPKNKAGRPRKRKADTTASDNEDNETPKSLRTKAAKKLAHDQGDEDEEDAPAKILKKIRKTPAKSTKSATIVKEEADADEDMAENINVASDKPETAEEESKL